MPVVQATAEHTWVGESERVTAQRQSKTSKICVHGTCLHVYLHDQLLLPSSKAELQAVLQPVGNSSSLPSWDNREALAEYG